MRKLENVPVIWRQYIIQLENELRKIEQALIQAGGAETSELRARAERIRQSIAHLS